MKIAINIKNMVCNRCIKVIKVELKANNIAYESVNLGKVLLDQDVFNQHKETIKKVLKKEGFEWVENRDAQLVNQVKSVIIANIHYKKGKAQNQNFSTYLSSKLAIDYSYLSKLFSETEGKTIEQFTIAQKIERAKELLIYDELTLSQISYELNYSSPQHLSRQFKQVSGLTPTIFKKIGKRKKLDTI
jgi:YesN/AraC family two-component response regulator